MSSTTDAPGDYDPQQIEPRWQEFWRTRATYEVDNDDPRPGYYVLCMYPYPSGAAHMGHVRNYTFGDLLTRYRTMRGDAVLSPMGFDSFGLPAENAAISTGVHPRTFTDERIEELREQEELDRVRPEIDGNEIAAVLDIEPGPVLGEAYRFLLQLRLDEGPIGKDVAAERLRAWWAQRG